MIIIVSYSLKYGNLFLFLLIYWHHKPKMINGNYNPKFSGNINVSPNGKLPF